MSFGHFGVFRLISSLVLDVCEFMWTMRIGVFP